MGYGNVGMVVEELDTGYGRGIRQPPGAAPFFLVS
jgi:hypothetical protein